MTDRRPAQPITLGVKIGFVLLAVGVTAWLFLGDWRYAVAGLIALVVAAVVGAPGKANR
jgi:hypothetical protein